MSPSLSLMLVVIESLKCALLYAKIVGITVVRNWVIMGFIPVANACDHGTLMLLQAHSRAPTVLRQRTLLSDAWCAVAWLRTLSSVPHLCVLALYALGHVNTAMRCDVQKYFVLVVQLWACGNPRPTCLTNLLKQLAIFHESPVQPEVVTVSVTVWTARATVDCTRQLDYIPLRRT